MQSLAYLIFKKTKFNILSMKIGGKEVKIYFHSEDTIEYKGLIKKNWDIYKIQVCSNKNIWFNVTSKFIDSSAKIEKTTHIVLKKGAFKTGLYAGITAFYLILLNVIYQ